MMGRGRATIQASAPGPAPEDVARELADCPENGSIVLHDKTDEAKK